MKKYLSVALSSFALLALVSGAHAQSIATQHPARIVVNKTTPVFVKPDTTITPMRLAKEGSALNVLAMEDDWYRVEFQDPQFGRRIGYIEKRYVTALSTPRIEEPPVDLTVAEARPTIAEVTPARTANVAQTQPRDLRASSTDAAPVPAWETSIGWGLVHMDGLTSPLGWRMSIAGSLTPWLSAVGEFGGNYKSYDVADINLAGLNHHNFMGGTRFTGRFVNGRVNPFGQFLAGVTYTRVGVFDTHVGSSTNFAIQPGGGIDIGLSDAVALRMQVDLRTVFGDGGSTNMFRFSPGIVIRAF